MPQIDEIFRDGNYVVTLQRDTTEKYQYVLGMETPDQQTAVSVSYETAGMLSQILAKRLPKMWENGY